MSTSSPDKTKNIIYVALLVIAVGAAGYFLFFRGGPAPADDPATRAAAEKNNLLQSKMDSGKSQPADIPVENRSPRGRPVKQP